MSLFVWNEENNFILLHSIHHHSQRQSSINWSAIVHDIRLDINSTEILLKNQYEYLCEVFRLKDDPNLLYSIVKHEYLQYLCQNLETDSNLQLIVLYQFVKHQRIQRINVNDIQCLIINWDFNYSSDEEKQRKTRLLNTLNRLSKLSSQTIEINQEVGLFCRTRRGRTRSLTVSLENQSTRTTIGVEWFAPIKKRQRRFASLNADENLEEISSSESDSFSVDINENSRKRQRVV